MPAAFSCSLASCAAQTDLVISDLRGIANIIFFALGAHGAACLIHSRARLNLDVMLIETIREFNRAVPFQPYEIRTNGRERLQVPHPDFIFVSPKGAWVIVTDARERPRHISSILIEEVAPVRK